MWVKQEKSIAEDPKEEEMPEEKASYHSPRSAMAAQPASSSAQPSATEIEQLVWQAILRLVDEAVPIVARLQHERVCKRLSATGSSSLPAAISARMLEETAASLRSSLSARSSFHFVSVPNTVLKLRKLGCCSYHITSELGSAENPWLCLTCSEADATDASSVEEAARVGWEICESCAEKSACHSGHTLSPLVSRGVESGKHAVFSY
jgi:hypothetical protein